MKWFWATRADERGSGSILVVAIIAAVLCLTALTVPLWAAMVVAHRVATAADAAALAAADGAVGRVAGEPCSLAVIVAGANGATITACEVDGLVVTVRTEQNIWGFPVRATSTAGPPHHPISESLFAG